MQKYIIETIVTGKRYYEVEAKNENEAIKLAHDKYANKKLYTKDGTELNIYDDIDTFTVVDKISNESLNVEEKIKQYIDEIDLEINKLENKKLNSKSNIYDKGEINGQLIMLFNIKENLLNIIN